MFRRDEHYVDYENEDDLLGKLRHYLAHPHECIEIARAGHQAFVNKHRPAQRIRDVLAFAFGDGAVPPARDRRALPGNHAFGDNLDARVRLYEICQTLSLRNERSVVVMDVALGARTIADLVDLPRLKIYVPTHTEPSGALRQSLNRLDAFDQIEFIDGDPVACDIAVMDARRITSRSSVQSTWAQMLLVMAGGDVTEGEAKSLAAKGFARVGQRLWACQNQTPGRNQPCPCGSGKRYKHCHGALTG